VLAAQLQRLEVRAFGCLLEELLERCDESPSNHGVLRLLNDLKLACLSDENGHRPFFDEINALLVEAIRKL